MATLDRRGRPIWKGPLAAVLELARVGDYITVRSPEGSVRVLRVAPGGNDVLLDFQVVEAWNQQRRGMAPASQLDPLAASRTLESKRS